jgi:hypothetical protein
MDNIVSEKYEINLGSQNSEEGILYPCSRRINPDEKPELIA